MYSERCVSLVFLFWGEVGKFRSSRVVPRERSGMRNVRRVHVTDIWSWYRVELRVGGHLGSV